MQETFSLTEMYFWRDFLTDNSSLVITGQGLWGRGTPRRTEQMIEELLGQETRNVKIHILAYVFSKYSNNMIELIEGCLGRNCTIKMIVNDLYKKEEPLNAVDELERLNKTYDNFHLASFDKDENAMLHAKVIVVNRKKALVGSANISFNAMNKNYEIGLYIHDGDHPPTLALMIDDLMENNNLCTIVEKPENDNK